ncbi:MAG: SDR family NAD(P)-dependent oxidoreductase [Pseudorhodoplanes sp.]|uniref:SDR family NAD(P)-dependent oxidoreductase n=1 Tax=Pseudorhodoplanes sp. TaxID=1934341 RepID=UPI003D115F6C
MQKDWRRLCGKRAIVTGAARGIGRAIAALFSEHGASVACFDLDESAMTSSEAPKIDRDGNLIVQGDATSEADIRRAVERTIESFGGVDILVNNVGLSTRGTIEETAEQDWDRVSLNTKCIYLASRLVLPHFRKAGGGVIINIGSGAGVRGFPGAAAYGTSKAGVIALTQLMAMDHGKDRVRVNCVCPGLTDTEISRRNRLREAGKTGKSLDQVTQEMLPRYPLGRIGQPIDTAYAVLFLASDEASWISGTTLMVDGGRCAGAY